jgi:hypothetical protein
MISELTAIGISLASLHIPYDGQNQFNPGIHFEAQNARFGAYVNSRDRVTGYVGYQLPIASTNIAGVEIDTRVFAALASGYRSPVIGAVECVVGQRFVVLLAPTSDFKGITLGFALRFTTE